MRSFIFMLSDCLACRTLDAFYAWREGEEAHVKWYMTHRLKTTWIFSGVSRSSHNGVNSDLGFVRSDRRMNRRQALAELQRVHPGASVLHVDDRDKVITYMISI